VPWYPEAVRRPVTRFNPDGALAQQITPRRAIFHTAVSAARSLFDYFNQPGNPCSHWYVAADGYTEQYVDTDYRAPAQLEGNHDCLSWETQDIGGPFPAWSGSDVPAWTAAQVDRLTDIAAWVSQVHGIPLVQIPDSVDGRTGFGYHRLGVNPWRVPGGELWSNAYGKVCPGDRRIAQIPGILAAAAQGDDVTEEQYQDLWNKVHRIEQGVAPPGTIPYETTGEVTLTVRALETAVAALTAKVDQLLARPGGDGLSFDEVKEAARQGANEAEDS